MAGSCEGVVKMAARPAPGSLSQSSITLRNARGDMADIDMTKTNLNPYNNAPCSPQRRALTAPALSSWSSIGSASRKGSRSNTAVKTEAEPAAATPEKRRVTYGND